MKTIKLVIAAMAAIILTSGFAMAQDRGNGNVTKEKRDLAVFDAIKVGCAINLFVAQGEPQTVEVEIDENLQDRINTKVVNGTLDLSCGKISNPAKMNVYVTTPKLTQIEATGASVVKGTLPLKSDVFRLNVSGAAKASIEVEANIFNNETSGAGRTTATLNVQKVNSEVSGAGTLTLKGNAETQTTEVSGAGILKAVELITDQTDAEVSGAGNAKITARKQLKADLSGAGSLIYFDKNELKKIAKAGEYRFTFDGMDNVKSVILEDDDKSQTGVNISPSEDTVSVVVNDKKIVVITDDSVKVNVGKRSIEIGEDGVKVKKEKKAPKFNGHWAGVELGVNGLLNSQNKIDYPAGYEYLDLNYTKSINVNVNLFEQSFNLINNKLGLVTGLGFSWYNYRFNDDVRLTDDGILSGYHDMDPARKYEKSKLVVNYLTVPLLLEYQTNSKSKANSFHISGGVEGGLRIGSHTKVVYNDGDRRKDKDPGQYYINPFKVDAVAKIGWGVVNLYGTYSLTEMFRTNKGPVAYPFAIGICLDNF